ncbi:glycosyltransferase family 2 protein, partial [Dorea formicigenerans]|uniref:glycosyltransferase family 2 protein n=1 Tax=Dorea formicigenerans TaxID=39486 RepID=UPI001EDCC064
PEQDRDFPRVSVIIPTRDKIELLSVCLQSMRSVTDYPSALIEVIVVDNGSTHPSALSYLEEHARRGDIKWIRQGGPFNF